MYVCMYVSTFVCTFVSTCVSLRMYLRMYLYVCLCIYMIDREKPITVQVPIILTYVKDTFQVPTNMGHMFGVRWVEYH